MLSSHTEDNFYRLSQRQRDLIQGAVKAYIRRELRKLAQTRRKVLEGRTYYHKFYAPGIERVRVYIECLDRIGHATTEFDEPLDKYIRMSEGHKLPGGVQGLSR